MSANKLARGMGGSDAGSGVMMARHLEAYAIVTVDMGPSPIPGRESMSVTLTAKGRALADALLHAVEAFPDPPSAPPKPPKLPRARPLREGRDIGRGRK